MGFELPHDKMREAIQEIDNNSSGSLDLLDFMEMILRCGASLSPCMFIRVRNADAFLVDARMC
jgi:hypothetical protein